jgi:site-specific recombinase XerD
MIMVIHQYPQVGGYCFFIYKEAFVDTLIGTVVNVIDVDWLDSFSDYLERNGSSSRTLLAYCQDVRSFASWFLAENGQVLEPGLITGVDLRAYRDDCVNGGRIKPATWNRRRQALARLCKFWQERGDLSYDPFQGVEPWVEEEMPPRWLGKSDLQRFMRQLELQVNGATTPHWRWQALRDQAMVMLMLYAGLREGEVVALNRDDIELPERHGKVTIWHGKGGKKREVPLNGEVRRALSMLTTTCPLFVGKGGERLTTRSVQRRVGEIGKGAGLYVTPHMLRHSFAKRTLDRGAPLTVVSKLLGHARVDTTARYCKPGWSDLEMAVE